MPCCHHIMFDRLSAWTVEIKRGGTVSTNLGNTSIKIVLVPYSAGGVENLPNEIKLLLVEVFGVKVPRSYKIQ